MSDENPKNLLQTKHDGVYITKSQQVIDIT